MMLMKATAADFSAVCVLYRTICDQMAADDSPQWVWGVYPSDDILQESLAAGTLYVAREGETLLAAVTVDTCFEPEYEGVNWLFGTRPGAFHRLAIAPDQQGRGLGRKLLNDVMALLRDLGCDALRIDTYATNLHAQRLYESCGMRKAGEVIFAHRPLPFYCYELPLTDACPLLPLTMHPAFRGGKLTPWGGEKLRTVYAKPIAEVPTGESLEISCIPGLESTDDAGVKLPDLVERYGARFAGKYAGKPFPLLLKFIDAAESLSVQVHPDDAYAGRVENGKLGKTEAWLILDAPKGSQLVYGIKAGTTLSELRAACEAGAAVEAYLRYVDVKPGDVCFIPAGCVHAIGAGIMLYEIQQSSDVTYRFYDWDRVDKQGNRRELHIDKALDVTDLDFVLGPIPAPDAPIARVLDEAYFTLDLMKVDGTQGVPAPEDFGLLSVLEGELTLCYPGGQRRLCKGESLYIPAASPALTLSGHGRAALSMPK
ncbi:MAG: GNAT family N-acetyltransferase [Clostridiales bacterium]|nr:GNAT family N-acetyltransferase [Clostridiales bacterium]